MTHSEAQDQRLVAERVRIRGAVQGVGFRPHVLRVARSLGLMGSVSNGARGVEIHVEGHRCAVVEFSRRLQVEAPASARIRSLERAEAQFAGVHEFSIIESGCDGDLELSVGPDLATCGACRRELLDPQDRRHRYPFLNCTECGPRFSIVRSLPYDRHTTTMAAFKLCPECRGEYEDPEDRRFHAQPTACARCGPSLGFVAGREPSPTIRGTDAALEAAREQLMAGRCVAIKGLGGFHLCVAADQDLAVRTLRQRKRRATKPFALLFRDLDQVERHARVDAEERRLLLSPAAPIVLLKKRKDARDLSDAVAPGHPELGCMIASNPLHILLLESCGFPLVATSANRREEPICTELEDARVRLEEFVDGGFLDHDRPIARPVDDSVVRVVAGRPMILRRARGYAPLPVGSDLLPSEGCELALGAHQKNAVAVRSGARVLVSAHVGDLETPQAFDRHRDACEDLLRLVDARPERILCDRHPDYASTRHAETLSPGPLRIGHHEAHVWSVIGEHGLRGRALGFAWDGTGFGEGDPDGVRSWGGEVFLRDVEGEGLRRVARLQPFPLPGGERASREGWRCVAGMAFDPGSKPSASLLRRARAFLEEHAQASEGLFRSLVARAEKCSSMGRLFDAVAALLDVRAISHYEGDAACRLEAAAWEALDAGRKAPSLDMPLVDHPAGLVNLDHRPLIEGLAEGQLQGESVETLALALHQALAKAVGSLAARFDCEQVALSGGCFQNRLLSELVIARLRAEGRRPFWPEEVPPNDGGICFGQVIAAHQVRPLTSES